MSLDVPGIIFPACRISDGGLIRVRRNGREPCSSRSGAGGPRRVRSGSNRLVLEVLLWLVGRYGEQGALLHVCSKAFQRRLFGMTSSEVGARRALGPSVALGVIPPICATLGPVLAGPEGCSRGRWRSGPSKWRHTAAPEGRGQGAPRTCRCIETQRRERIPVGSIPLSGSTTHL